jgi:hypothetical protein
MWHIMVGFIADQLGDIDEISWRISSKLAAGCLADQLRVLKQISWRISSYQQEDI